MRKILSYTVIALLAMHITMSFGNAEENIENIELNSAPIEQVAPISDGNGGTYSTWELMHRTFMLDGFTWTGIVADYITPHMWGGISGILGIENGAIYPIEPMNYPECVQSEMDASFGENGSMIESTATAELKNLAKYCATEFYGDYFSGKDYTTREEMTMFLLTALGEDVSLEGEFSGSAFVTNDTEIVTPFNNVVKTAWYAPFLARATEVNLLSSNPPRWKIAQEVTDEDIVGMLQGYFGTDESDANTLVKMIQAPTSEVVVNSSNGNSRYPGCDTDDIPVKVGDTIYYWAACNVGASKAGTGVESYGSYFQWGRNDTGWTSGWTAPDDAWGTTSNDTTATYATSTSANQAKMRGPCQSGYHIPTYKEADDTITIGFANNSTSFNTALKPPLSGFRGFSDGFFDVQSSDVNWWLSSPVSTYGRDVYWSSSLVGPYGSYNRAYGFGVRCVRN